MDNDLSFKNGNPGAVRFGNFINYYQFHSPDKRIKLLSKNIWSKWPRNSEISRNILDVGCNAGDLTIALYNFFTNTLKNPSCKMLGLDIDPALIERAIESNHSRDISFKCLDIMEKNASDEIIKYIKDLNCDKFDVVFCFSITMWIHLNHGDEGLKLFLNKVSELSDFLVIEPQPWKCYKTAIKRLKQSNCDFPMFKQLVIRQEVEEEIEHFIVNNCGLVKVAESERTEWGRKILFFKRKSV